MNGLYEEYYNNGNIYSRFNYINGIKEGDAYIFRDDSTIESHTKFWHGEPIESKIYDDKDKIYSAYPGFNFTYYVKKTLKKMNLSSSQGNIIVKFKIDETGKLSDSKVLMGVDPSLDQAIIETLNNSPKWIASKVKKKPIAQEFTMAFYYER